MSSQAARHPDESSLPFYHHANAERRAAQALPAVRWVKVAWLASLSATAPRRIVRDAAMAALVAVDDDDARGLVLALRVIEQDATTADVRALAADAASTVERAMAEARR